MINRGSPSHVDTGLEARDDYFHFTSPRDNNERQLWCCPPNIASVFFLLSCFSRHFAYLPATFPSFPPFSHSRHFFTTCLFLGRGSSLHFLLCTAPLGKTDCSSSPRECVSGKGTPLNLSQASLHFLLHTTPLRKADYSSSPRVCVSWKGTLLNLSQAWVRFTP